jgi:Skp family chaperone for outer membrane proteins
MKKFLISTLLGASMIMTFAGSAFSAPVVGIVDTKKIFESSKLFEALNKAKSDLGNLEEDIKKETLYKSKLLEEARAKKTKDADLQKMQEKFQKELEDKRTSAQEASEKKQKELEEMSVKLKADVENAIKDVATEKKLEAVVDKQAVLFGGTDITEDVIKKINEKK